MSRLFMGNLRQKAIELNILRKKTFPGSLTENSIAGPRASGLVSGKVGEAGGIVYTVDAGCHAHARVGMEFETDNLDSCLRKRKHGTPLEASSSSPTGSWSP